MRSPISSVIVFTSMFAIPVSFAAERVESVTSRGLSQKFVLTTTEERTPVAGVILLAGGHGKLDVGSSSGSVTFGWGGQNNLVRTRKMYADQGFIVATMDAPADQGKMNAIWRMSKSHAQDIRSVAEYLKQKANVPVWVIGTSMGSFSAANAGINLTGVIDGIVLTSSITRSERSWKIYHEFPNGVVNMNLSKVTVPVLIASHEADECDLSPAKDIELLASQFKSSKKVQTIVFSGAHRRTKSDPCGALSAHGYLDIENEVVLKISSFIKSN
jgi:hypothetical protein